MQPGRSIATYHSDDVTGTVAFISDTGDGPLFS